MENKEQYLDEFSKKIIVEAQKEEVPFEFTSSVMSKITTIQSKNLVYKPLIPKVVWVIILFTLFFWLVYLFKNYFQSNSGWFSELHLNNPFSEIQFSKITMYTIVLFAFMVCVQVPLLKYYFNKRLKM